MQKIENNTLQVFLDSFIEELKSENQRRNLEGISELDIPFIISSLYQSFINNFHKYQDFIKDLNTYADYNIIICDSINDYDGIIDVQIKLLRYLNNNNNDDPLYYEYDFPEYDYQLCFSYDRRDYGYCECVPEMIDYRKDKHCCGHKCDALFCSFLLHKVLHVISDYWHGDQHDYWEFEDEFYLNDKELADKKKEEDRRRQIIELKSRIKADQKKLEELENV